MRGKQDSESIFLMHRVPFLTRVALDFELVSTVIERFTSQLSSEILVRKISNASQLSLVLN